MEKRLEFFLKNHGKPNDSLVKYIFFEEQIRDIVEYHGYRNSFSFLKFLFILDNLSFYIIMIS